MARKFGVVIEKGDRGFLARCPEIQGCEARGGTVDEAMAGIKAAIEMALRSREDAACPRALPNGNSPESPTVRRRRMLLWTAGIAALLVGIGALGIVLAIRNIPMPGMQTERLTIQQINEIGHFTLPPRASNVRARVTEWLDRDLHVRFTIPPEQLNAFLETTLVKRPLLRNQWPTRGSIMGGGPDWWKPGTPAQFEVGTSDTDAPTSRPAISHYVIIDESNSQQYVVWMIATD